MGSFELVFHGEMKRGWSLFTAGQTLFPFMCGLWYAGVTRNGLESEIQTRIAKNYVNSTGQIFF
jgi:hypothetical protein